MQFAVEIALPLIIDRRKILPSFHVIMQQLFAFGDIREERLRRDHQVMFRNRLRRDEIALCYRLVRIFKRHDLGLRTAGIYFRDAQRSDAIQALKQHFAGFIIGQRLAPGDKQAVARAQPVIFAERHHPRLLRFPNDIA